MEVVEEKIRRPMLTYGEKLQFKSQLLDSGILFPSNMHKMQISIMAKLNAIFS